MSPSGHEPLRSVWAAALAALMLPTHIMAETSTSIVPTKNYIDTISGYAQLSTCAEDVLSTVVRAQYSGCGDANALTSYTCFCTDSSSQMSAIISGDVVSSCDAGIASAQASSAGVVFDKYCALGVSAGLKAETTADSSATHAASVSATPASSLTGATPSATSASHSPSGSLSSTNTAIIIGVVVSVCGTTLVFTAAWFWLRHKRMARASRAFDGADEPYAETMPVSRGDFPTKSELLTSNNCAEMPVTRYHKEGDTVPISPVAELGVHEAVAELPSR